MKITVVNVKAFCVYLQTFIECKGSIMHKTCCYQVEKLPWLPVQVVATVIYWGVQGTFFTAIFVIGKLPLCVIDMELCN